MAKPTHKEMQMQIISDNLHNFLSYMPNPDNIISGTFDSFETYRKMKTDPRINSLLNLLKTGSLNFPISYKESQTKRFMILSRTCRSSRILTKK